MRSSVEILRKRLVAPQRPGQNSFSVFVSSAFILLYNLGWELIAVLSPLGRRQQLELRFWAVIVGSALAIAFYVAIIRVLAGERIARPSRQETKSVLILLGITLLGGIIGILRGNDTYYMLSDTYKSGLIPLTLLVGLLMRPSRMDVSVIWKVLIGVLLIGQIAYLLRTLLAMLGDSYMRIPYKMWPNLVLLYCLFWVEVMKSSNRKLFAVARKLVLLVITTASAILAAYRTVLAAGVLAAVPVFIAWPRLFIRRVRASLIPCMGIALIVILAVLFICPQMLDVDLTESPLGAVWRRFSELGTKSIQEIGSLSVKLTEAQYALQTLLDAGFMTVLIGLGSGAEYQVPVGTKGFEEYADRDHFVHHIHVFYIAILFRYGVLGLASLLWMMLSVLRGLRAAMRRRVAGASEGILRLSWLYGLVLLGVGLFFPVWLGDGNLGILLMLSYAFIRTS